jgi:hypothetical protein
MLGFEVLSLHEVGISHIQSGLAEGAAVEVLWLNGRHVSCVSGDLRDCFLLIDGLKLVVYFFGDVAV